VLNQVAALFPPNRFPQISKTMVAVSSTTRAGIREVMEEIEVLADILRMPVDPTWLNVQQHIRAIHDRTPFISRKHFIQLSYRHGVVYEKLRPMVRYFQAIGLIAYFDDGFLSKLKNMVVIDVKWLGDLILRWLGTADRGQLLAAKAMAAAAGEEGESATAAGRTSSQRRSLSQIGGVVGSSAAAEAAGAGKRLSVSATSVRATAGAVAVSNAAAAVAGRKKSFQDLPPSTLFGKSMPARGGAGILADSGGPSLGAETMVDAHVLLNIANRESPVPRPQYSTATNAKASASKKSPVTFSRQESATAARVVEALSGSPLLAQGIPGVVAWEEVDGFLFDIPKNHFSNVLHLLSLLRFICFRGLGRPVTVPLLLPLSPDENVLAQLWPINIPVTRPFTVEETHDVLEFEAITIEFFGRLLSLLSDLDHVQCRLLWRDGCVLHRSAQPEANPKMLRHTTVLVTFSYWSRESTVNRISVRTRAATLPRRASSRSPLASPSAALPDFLRQDQDMEDEDFVETKELRDQVLASIEQFVKVFYGHLVGTMVRYSPSTKSDDPTPAVQTSQSVRSRSYSYVSARAKLPPKRAGKVQQLQPPKHLDSSPDRRKYRAPLLEQVALARHATCEVQCMAFVDAKTLWVAGDDGFIEVYELLRGAGEEEGRLASTGVRWKAHSSRITSMAAVRQHLQRGFYAVRSSAPGVGRGRRATEEEAEEVVGTVWTGAKDGTLRVWDVNSTQLLHSCANENEVAAVQVVQFNEGNSEVWTVSPTESAIRIWDVADFSMKRVELELYDDAGRVPYISCMTQQRSWVLVGAERWICIIDVHSKEMKGYWRVNHDAIRGIHAVAGTNFVWSYSLYSPVITVWLVIDLESIEEVKHLEVHKAKLTGIHSMITCTGQSIVITGAYDKKVVIWDAVTLRALGKAQCTAAEGWGLKPTDSDSMLMSPSKRGSAAAVPSEIPSAIHHSKEGIVIATGFKDAGGLQSNLHWFRSSTYLDKHVPINIDALVSILDDAKGNLVSEIIAPGDKQLAEIESHAEFPPLAEALALKIIEIAEAADGATLDDLLEIAGDSGELVQKMGALRDDSIMAADLVLPLYINGVACAMGKGSRKNVDIYHAIVNLQYAFVDFGNNNAACQLSHVIVAAQVVPQLLQLKYK